MVSKALSPDLHRAFRAALPAQDAFLSAGSHAVLTQLGRAIAARLPLILLTAAAGTGKTLLIRYFLETRPKSSVARTIYYDPAEYGDLTVYLGEILRTLDQTKPPRLVLVLDDATALSPPQQQLVLRIATASRESGGPIIIVLIGQSDLPAAIRTWRPDDPPEIHEIRMAPLGPEEVAAYLGHRLGIASGPEPLPLPFDGDALQLLFDLSDGIPRFLDHFAERALYEAAQDGRASVDADLLRASLMEPGSIDLGLPQTRPKWSRNPAPSAKPQSQAPDKPPMPATLRAHPNEALQPRTARRHGRTVLIMSMAFCVMTGAGLVYLAAQRGDPRSWLTHPPPTTYTTTAQAPADNPPDLRQSLTTAIETLPVIHPGLPSPLTITPEPDPTRLMRLALSAEGVQIDRAVLNYELAALLGNARAAYYLGQLLELGGVGLPANPTHAQAWYSVAAGIEAAETRHRLLAQTLPGDGTTGAPQPVHHAIFPSGRVALHWRSSTGQPAQRYLVEYAVSGGDGATLQTQTTLTATLLDRPIIGWRVISLDMLGHKTAASGWSKTIPPAR